MELLKFNAEFEYADYPVNNLEMIWETNLLRIKIKDDLPAEENFGKIKDLDGTVYAAKEILIHTPAEHTMAGHTYDMEIQVVHVSIEGNFRNQAILSFLFKDEPGQVNVALSEWNLINLPNPKDRKVNDFFGKPLNVWKFLYDNSKLANPPPFNYFKYMGSMTTPPCEENIVWFIASQPLNVGSTILSMIKDTLFAPGKTAYDKEPNYDGTNRVI